MKYIILGCSCFLVSVWGGAYLLGTLPTCHWATEAIRVTQVFILVVSAVMAGMALINWLEGK